MDQSAAPIIESQTPVSDPPSFDTDLDLARDLYSAPRPKLRPPVFIRGSIGLHAGIALAVASNPDNWRPALAAIAANHLAITASVFMPRSSLLGPNLVRLSEASARRGEVALTFDDGPDPEVTPLVLDLLDRHRVQASFFCIGAKVDAHPGIAREIVRRGHAIENHAYTHRHNFSILGPRGYDRELRRAQEAIFAATSTTPRFFRAPAGLRNPFLDPVLVRLGLRLCSWTRRGYDTALRNPNRVASRLINRLAAGDIVLLHDGNCARTARGMPVVVEVLPRVLEVCAARGLNPVRLSVAE